MTGAQRRGIDVGALAALDVRGAAVLLHTGDDPVRHAGLRRGRALSRRARGRLAGRARAALVGIDAVNIDDPRTARPAHSLLLAAGIRGRAPDRPRAASPGGAWFTAATLRIEGFGTIPVRAFARLPG